MASDQQMHRELRNLVDRAGWNDVVAIMYWRTKRSTANSGSIRSHFDALGKCLFCEKDIKYQKKVGEHIGKCRSIDNHYRKRARSASMTDLACEPWSSDSLRGLGDTAANMDMLVDHSNSNTQRSAAYMAGERSNTTAINPAARPALVQAPRSMPQVPTTHQLAGFAILESPVSHFPIDHRRNYSSSTTASQHRRTASDQTDDSFIASPSNSTPLYEDMPTVSTFEMEYASDTAFPSYCQDACGSLDYQGQY